jgi:chaperonin cofactor prefoldin
MSNDKASTVQKDSSMQYNGGGGEPPMKNDYVTHEELDQATDQLNHRIDMLEAHIDTKFESVNTKFESMNTKFSDMKVWFLGIVITVILSGLFFK